MEKGSSRFGEACCSWIRMFPHNITIRPIGPLRFVGDNDLRLSAKSKLLRNDSIWFSKVIFCVLYCLRGTRFFNCLLFPFMKQLVTCSSTAVLWYERICDLTMCLCYSFSFGRQNYPFKELWYCTGFIA